MTYILNRQAPVVVILLSLFVLAGCSGVFGDTPREQADEAINNANESISQHNELFNDARSTYADVKAKIEAGDDPSKEKDEITGAKNDLEEARKHLQDAEASLATVNDLDVDPAVKEYAKLLSEAMQDQLDAEAKEIEFYGILEKDPALEENREQALDLLSEVSEGYQQAEKAYGEAQEFADAHPELIEAN
jgi:DNA repair exonuclease SbcCD ATPase subunit